MKKYFLTYEVKSKNRKTIWGTGTTKKQSLKDAHAWAKAWGHSQIPIKLRTVICDFSLFNYIKSHGGMSVPWKIHSNSAYLHIERFSPN